MKAIRTNPWRALRPGVSVAGRSGFSLLEVIVVLALMSILGTIAVESLFVRIVQGQRDENQAALDRYIGAVESSILRTQTVPSASELPGALAEEMGIPSSLVAVNRSGYARAFRWDPSCRVGADSDSVPPYVQSSSGSVSPVNSRLLMISCVGRALPTLGTSQTAFDAMWGTAEDAVPASWTGWAADGMDLRIRRLNIQGLFQRVVLNNLDPVSSAVYSLTGSTNVILAPRQQVVAWFIRGSQMVFRYPNGAVQASEFIETDSSYSHENGRWGKGIDRASPPSLGGFATLIEEFLAVGVGNRVPQFGASPQAVVDEVFTYLWNYGMWATGDPPYAQPFEVGGGTSAQQIPAFRVVNDGEARLEAVTANLIN